jgi:hypothetical protein
MPVFADSLSVGDKPMVVAEGADVRIGGVLYMTDRGHHHHHDREDNRR